MQAIGFILLIAYIWEEMYASSKIFLINCILFSKLAMKQDTNQGSRLGYSCFEAMKCL